ncbi:DUF6234 family protein [Streptomyces sp. NPDC101165]|uniref:DUF6234 family protein n=1 Tax=Streptomyces sp. NPDC101165 TaxID=3366119 RepID=UPI0038200367
MTERTPGGCAAAALATAELAALAVIFLSWWGDTYFNWDPQHVGPRVGPYVQKMGGVAALAVVAALAAAVRRTWRMAWTQALIVALALGAMAGTHALGTSAHSKQQRQACNAGLAASYCTNAR